MKIDPWAATQYSDYTKLKQEFGIEDIDISSLPNPNKLLRRGVVFGQRGFSSILDALKKKKKFAIMTGLVPSGPMHIGHKLVIDQVIYFQSLGAEVFIAVADIEAYAVRNINFKLGEKIAIDDYIVNYIALGLKNENCQIYFQSKRKEVKDLGIELARKTNLSEMKAIYGFADDTNIGHLFSPLIQVGDILHVQLEKFGGPKPTIVPVGVDQDPHIRLTRELAFSTRLYNVLETKDGIGIFVKGEEEDVEKLLNKAEEKALSLGFKNLKKIPTYRALYITDGKKEDIKNIDEELINLEFELGYYGFYLPSATYNRFMTGLTGDKMSSSKPETCIFLNEKTETAIKKVKGCKTGGGTSIEEQRKYGGKPEQCIVFELLLYHFIEDDNELEEIFKECKNGDLLCGRCKEIACDRVKNFLNEMNEKREIAKEKINEYVVED
ncbi:MAG: tryptophan--tRNA ligase [Candidatus Thermoplasmatota archaeon]